jgi:hypothetical protein
MFHLFHYILIQLSPPTNIYYFEFWLDASLLIPNCSFLAYINDSKVIKNAFLTRKIARFYESKHKNVLNWVRNSKISKISQTRVKSVQLVKIAKTGPISRFYIKIKTVVECWVSTPLSPFPMSPHSPPDTPLFPFPIFLSPFPKLKDQRRKCWIWVTTIFMTYGVSITSALIIGLRPLKTKGDR